MKPRFSLTLLLENVRSPRWPFRKRYSLKNKLDDRMIKQLLNSVIEKYRDMLISVSQIDYLAQPSECSPLTNYDISLNLVQ